MWKKRSLSILLAVTTFLTVPACAGNEDDDPGPATDEGGSQDGGLEY